MVGRGVEIEAMPGRDGRGAIPVPTDSLQRARLPTGHLHRNTTEP